jgi:4-carboxymuconolactone decarboxylase
MTRAPGLRPGDLDDAQRELYATLTGGRRSSGPQVFSLTDDEGRLRGPFDLMLLDPSVGTAVQQLGAAVRFGGRLGARERELAIVAVGGAWDSGFELYAHRAIGAQAGLSEAELTAAENGDGETFADHRERVVVTTAAALARRHDLDDDAFGEAEDALGAATLYELTTLVGYYALIALQLKVYRVAVPTD